MTNPQFLESYMPGRNSPEVIAHRSVGNPQQMLDAKESRDFLQFTTLTDKVRGFCRYSDAPSGTRSGKLDRQGSLSAVSKPIFVRKSEVHK